MSPLTHAVVGMALCGPVRSSRLGRLGWPLALALALASHFVLDSIPHLDAIGPLRELRYGGFLFLLFGLIGFGFALYLLRRDRNVGWIWVLLSVWLVVSSFSGGIIRGLTALVLVGWFVYRTRQVDAPAYLLAAILAIFPDFFPLRIPWLREFHDAMHYSVGWGLSLFYKFQGPPIPSGNLARVENFYFQAGLGLEVLVEALIFLFAFLSFSKLSIQNKPKRESPVTRETEETSVPV